MAKFSTNLRDLYTMDQTQSWQLFKIMAEFVEGYDLLSQNKNEVTVFGSARTKPEDPYYQKALELGKLLGKHKFSVVTGGGPGIMEAANKGAFEAGGVSIGLGIELPMEQKINHYTTHSQDFSYFFTRKVMLTTPSQAFVCFPGGYGTLDEFYQIINEMSLGFTQQVPVILVGSEFWDPLMEFMTNKCNQSLQAITQQDLDMIYVVDTAEEAFEIIKNTKDHPNIEKYFSQDTSYGLNWRIFRIMAEFVEGLDFLNQFDKNVTILGTNKIHSGHRYYESMYSIAQSLVRHQYSILTGGGFGVAEAANRAAFEAKEPTYAITLKSTKQNHLNPYVTDYIQFQFPFTRQFILTGPANQYIFAPAGLGTLHQLFEVLTLQQTHKVDVSPMILFDTEFWQPLVDYTEEILCKKFHTINPEDLQLYRLASTTEEVIDFIKEGSV